MKKLMLAFVVLLLVVNIVSADTFGTGANQFTIDFVDISGDASTANGTDIGTGKTFSDPSYDYRMGTYEVTNDQWNKFKAEYGAVLGTPASGYDYAPKFPGTSVPTNSTSWYEAAQFVNWLNTFNGHQAAYKFTGTQGTSDYSLGAWNSSDAWGGTNLYRHKDAYYFLPTEDEWVKTAYWNGTTLQQYATKAGESLTQGNGTSGMGWNYYTTQYATNPKGPWNVGSGSQELNNTYDMMGNAFEWVESPWSSGDYLPDSLRSLRGGSYHSGTGDYLASSARYDALVPGNEAPTIGFRVASIPEPATLYLFILGGLVLRKRNSK